jgi:radical SAM protein with 4Fe4S-binding SPASM domain
MECNYENDIIEVIIKEPIILDYNKYSVVFINPNEPKWIKTNSTGKFIYELLVENKIISLQSIFNKLSKFFSLPVNAINDPIINLINKLNEDNFIKVKNAKQLKEIKENNKGITNDDLPNLGLASVWFNIISQCNLKCIHCFKKSESNTKPVTMKKAKYILEELEKNHVKKLYISGGEPLLHPNLLDIVKLAKQISNWEVVLITNGYTDNIDLFQELAEHLWCIQFSIDGINSGTHDSIRGKNSFEKAINLIHNLNNKKIKVLKSIAFTPHPYNVEQIPELFNFALKLKMDTIHITKPQKPAFINDKEDISIEFLSIEFRKKVFEYYDKLIQTYAEQYKFLKTYKDIKIPMIETSFDPCLNLLVPIKKACCSAGGTHLYINEEGDCYPCAILQQEKNYLGNVFEKSLNEIHKIEGILKFRQDVHVDKIPECQNCAFKQFCAGDCRALYESNKETNPYCGLTKSRYHNYLKNISN